MADKRKTQDSKTTEEKTPSLGEVQIPIELRNGPDVASRYANHVLVQGGQKEVFISFFEIRPPFLIGTPEEITNQAKKIASVPADCVGRIVVPNELMPNIIQAFQAIWDKKRDRTELSESESGETGKKKPA